ncbi:DUF4386 domain-containing protein [Ferruginibacter sp.]|uniref:DUF4386 domain-containing protein n=1 Tax=Ferruginibacter sp. TaxID=1940288 RepID=UPI00265992CD|nr:DUF4386 domain-containing protein [Ferruginibacter sp.]
MQTSMSPLRKTSLTAGIIYLLTFVSIPTLTLYGPIHQPNYILSNSNDTPVIIGGILEIIVGLTSVATAVVLYPVLKKQHEGFALGLVASRILEASTIFVGVAFLLAAMTLHKNGGGADSLSTSHALVALYDRIFLLGQGYIPAINDLLLGILLFKSRLVPRTLSIIGIAGEAPLIAGYLAVMFGVIDSVSPLAALSALPVAVFEFSLGIYLVIKGFRPSAVSNQL